MDERKLVSSTPLHDMSRRERSEIIRIYAEQINLLCDFLSLDEHGFVPSKNPSGGESDRSAGDTDKLEDSAKQLLARHLIEQYYNTGDSGLFDDAMRMNEDVVLEPWSILDLRVNEELAQGGNVSPVVVFYQGLFFRIDDNGIRNDGIDRYRVIVRDVGTVDNINLKLGRSRRLLMIDELTIGKKYYEGLWLRSHYYKQQYSF